MKRLSFERFLDDFGRAAKPVMNMSTYRANFDCACGRSPWFDERIDIVCEGLMKVMVTCPVDRSWLTSLKIKTFLVLKFKGFERLAGTQVKSDADRSAFDMMRRVFRR